MIPGVDQSLIRTILQGHSFHATTDCHTEREPTPLTIKDMSLDQFWVSSIASVPVHSICVCVVPPGGWEASPVKNLG